MRAAAMSDLSAELLSAAEAGLLGLALADADRALRSKVGELVQWLPPEGEDCCQSTLLAGMEADLAELAKGARDNIVLPGVRGALAGREAPITAVISWNAGRGHFVILATPDHTALQVETLMGSERRSRRLIEQQLEAATTEARFASFARQRLRLARDLHDTLVHSIMALLTQIRVVQHFARTEPAKVADALAEAEEAALTGLARARDAIARLRVPDELEPAQDVESILADFSDRTGLPVESRIGADTGPALRKHAAIVQRILSEALRNIEIHAQASHVQLRAAMEETMAGGRLVLDIRDDGRGFDPQTRPEGHFGLVGVTEFAALAGGVCTVDSAPGRGTQIRVELPFESALTAPAEAQP